MAERSLGSTTLLSGAGCSVTRQSLTAAVARSCARTNGSWRVDETYLRVAGKSTYLYRAVDSTGVTIDFLLSARRDAPAAKSNTMSQATKTDLLAR